MFVRASSSVFHSFVTREIPQQGGVEENIRRRAWKGHVIAFAGSTVTDTSIDILFVHTLSNLKRWKKLSSDCMARCLHFLHCG